MNRNVVIFSTLLLITLQVSGQNRDTLEVHCIYGSKPRNAFKGSEPKWFGGKLGGHIGIEGSSGMVLSFLPQGKFHIFSKPKNKHSHFKSETTRSFYSLFGGNIDSLKRVIFFIPISPEQRHRFDSLSSAYLNQTPYDYAFFGMRCAAATYDILAQLGIAEKHSRPKTVRKIFYPRRLRKYLFHRAEKQSWRVTMNEGGYRRKWDKG